MRWSYCHICTAEDETTREDKTIVHIYECHCCWKEYCDIHGPEEVRICESCLEEAYRMNKERERVK